MTATSLPRISVIVVNYNSEHWLDKCLTSISVQTYAPLEVILVDNASTNEDWATIAARFPSVLQIRSPINLGFAGGNNLGIDAASGDFLLLLNADAWLEPDAISSLFAELCARKLDLIAPVEIGYASSANATERRYYSLDVLGHCVSFGQPSQRGVFYVSGACLLVSRRVYFGSGGLDSDFFMYFEESDWCWRLHLYGYRLANALSTTVHHAGSSGTIGLLRAQMFIWRNVNCLTMLLKNYSALSLVLVLPIYFLQNCVEICFFLFTGKISIARTYFAAWAEVVRNFRSTLLKRHGIQSNRRVSDLVILRKMSWLPGKLLHLMQWPALRR